MIVQKAREREAREREEREIQLQKEQDKLKRAFERAANREDRTQNMTEQYKIISKITKIENFEELKKVVNEIITESNTKYTELIRNPSPSISDIRSFYDNYNLLFFNIVLNIQNYTKFHNVEYYGKFSIEKYILNISMKMNALLKKLNFKFEDFKDKPNTITSISSTHNSYKYFTDSLNILRAPIHSKKGGKNRKSKKNKKSKSIKKTKKIKYTIGKNKNTRKRG